MNNNILINPLLSVLVIFCIGIGISSCSPKLGRHSFTNPPKGDGYFWIFAALEANLLKLGKDDDASNVEKSKYIDMLLLNPTNSYLDFSIEYYGLKVGTDCCQTATILMNGLPTGGTREVITRRYGNNNLLINGRLYPLNFFKLNSERTFSPYLIGSVGYYKYFFEDYVLTSDGSYYDSKKNLAKGFFQGVGVGLYYMIEDDVSFFLEYRNEFNKNRNNENLNGGLFTVGIRFL